MSAIPPYPIYNSTFTTHRISPLYHGTKELLDEQVLVAHARRLGDIVRGETVRGVHIGRGAQDDASNKSGALQECSWDLIGDESTWRSQYRPGSDDEMEKTELSALQVGQETLRGIHVQLQFEKATHSALLLRDPSAEFATPGFTSLPLLMVRMPPLLREVFLQYLQTTFDTRISALKLSSDFLTNSMEKLLQAANMKENAHAWTNGLQLQLVFPGMGPSLRNIDVTVATEDIGRFLLRGQTMLQPGVTNAFTSALKFYLRQHLALDLAHPCVQVSRVICGPLALSTDGKLKLFPWSETESMEDGSLNEEATFMDEIYAALCREAATPAVFTAQSSVKQKEPGIATNNQDDTMELPSTIQARSSISPQTKRQLDSDTISVVDPRRKHARSSIPVEPPPPYELHDPSRRLVS